MLILYAVPINLQVIWTQLTIH